jgi:hypothetical protein
MNPVEERSNRPDGLADRLHSPVDEGDAVHQDWRRRMRQGQAVVQEEYNELVARVGLVRHFETVLVPGLLQTADYARRVLAEMAELHGPGLSDVEAAVATRLQRQHLLYDSGKQFEFLLAEPVLRWTLCSPEIMRGQLDRLQTVIGLSNVRFGVLPFDVRLTTIPQNSFQMYDDTAIVETFVGETTHRDDESAAYAAIMDRLWSQAATGADAQDLIIKAAQDLHAG